MDYVPCSISIAYICTCNVQPMVFYFHQSLFSTPDYETGLNSEVPVCHGLATWYNDIALYHVTKYAVMIDTFVHSSKHENGDNLAYISIKS